jgi:hypothetical protein
MYKHDFKELWRQMIIDEIPHKKIQSRQSYIAISDSHKHDGKKETFRNNESSSSMSSDQHNETKEDIPCNIQSSLPLLSGPGGGPINVFSRDELEQYMLNPDEFKDISSFIFDGHMTASAVEEKLKTDKNLLQCQIPISKLVSKSMSISIIKSLGQEHNIDVIRKAPKDT